MVELKALIVAGSRFKFISIDRSSVARVTVMVDAESTLKGSDLAKRAICLAMVDILH